jgi:hypothetical protein
MYILTVFARSRRAILAFRSPYSSHVSNEASPLILPLSLAARARMNVHISNNITVMNIHNLASNGAIPCSSSVISTILNPLNISPFIAHVKVTSKIMIKGMNSPAARSDVCKDVRSSRDRGRSDGRRDGIDGALGRMRRVVNAGMDKQRRVYAV